MDLLAGLARPGEVAVIGLGRSGVGAVKLLRSVGAEVYGSDGGDGPAVQSAAIALRATGALIDVASHDLGRIARSRLLVLSPGVPPEAEAVTAATRAGVPVWAEAELGLRALRGIPFVAVTGTNGKTTTTAIAGHLLARAGRRARTAGNIGTPLTEVALGPERPEVMAVELSSFQLHDMPSIAPTVGVLTNLAPDHLDRYPSLDAYYADKIRLFANATPASHWITNADDPVSDDRAGTPAGRRERFSVLGRAAAWYDRAGDQLMLGDDVLLPRARFPLLGDHNVANALAAALAGRALGLTVAELADGLASVAALPHRMEPVADRAGILWINDSKATNVASTTVAVAAMKRPFVLLLGGRHKGEPYRGLIPLLGRCRGVIAYGEAGPLIVADLGGSVPVTSAGDFADVVAKARALARPGDAVLLSPACSSYDMFANYEERGARFRAAAEDS